MAHAYIALGANIGDCRQNFRDALRMLPQDVLVEAASSLYESDAVTLDGEEQPLYLNAAVRLRTDLHARDLLDACKAIEQSLGRNPDAPRWSPRPIDIDLLLYRDDVIEEEGLIVPHRRMLERAFVLIPLAEIAPDVIHPLSGRKVADLAAEVGTEGVRKLEGAGWAAMTT